MQRIGWNFRKYPPTPLNRSTTDGERDQVQKIFIPHSQSKEDSTRWFNAVKSRPLDRLVFYTAKWFKMFFFHFSYEFFRQCLPYQRVCWRSVCNFGQKIDKKRQISLKLKDLAYIFWSLLVARTQIVLGLFIIAQVCSFKMMSGSSAG